MKIPKLQYLTDYSPYDGPWDAHRSVSDDVGAIYLLAAEYERYGARMASCGGLLLFGRSTLKETGETRL
ncbi:Replication protein, partial [Escherichia coli]|nr:Replication protein [Escherichia coli]